jgi:hypothetical protein
VFNTFRSSDLNDAGQILFYATIDSPTPADSGIFLSDGNTFQTVVRKGQAAPGNGVFDGFREPAFNDVGQAVFFAGLTQTIGGSLDNLGLYWFDANVGLVKVARKGDSLLGSTITDLRVGPTLGLLGDERSGLNDHGQVAFMFLLADGRGGVAVWTPVPEPASFLLLLVGYALASSLRRRTRRS